MKSRILSQIKFMRRFPAFFSTAALMVLMTVFCQIGLAQQAQLSLADILVGLRSKKVSLDERNRLLADAVKARGITFSITPEIETELAGTGANGDLVNAIKQKSTIIKVSATIKPEAAVNPAPTLDFAFYRKRGDDNTDRGAFELALGDYNKAVELNPKDAATYLNRGRLHSSKKSFDLALLDYDKTIELSPKESMAYFGRGEIQERRGNAEKAISDYQKAVEFDANNELAKNSLKRLQEEQTKIEQAKAEQAKIEQEKIEKAKILAKQKEATLAATPTPKLEDTPKTPKNFEVGSLIGQVVKMIMPFYPPLARQSNISGQVSVQITLDEKGEVISAKAVSGPAMLRATSEEAARRTKFKPFLVGNEAVKANGYIVYNFNGK